MFFLRLHCKKGNFLPFAIWFLLSIWLTSNLKMHFHLIKQWYANDTINASILYPQNKYNQSGFITGADKKFAELHTYHTPPATAFQGAPALNIFPNLTIINYAQLRDFQPQHFLHQRAPPLA